MRTWSIIAAWGIGLLVTAAETRAQSDPLGMIWGRDALSTCSYTEDGGKRNSTAALICLGWVSGAVQAASNTISMVPEKPDYCTPDFGGSTGNMPQFTSNI